MKKITMNINDKLNNKKAMEIRTSLSDLSGVVSADVAVLDAKAYAYAGDKLTPEAAVAKVLETGISASVVKEEYISDASDFKSPIQGTL